MISAFEQWALQGVRLTIHPLFWIVIVASIVTGYFMEIITLFVLVIIHELGHITAVRSFGWRVESIELLPFGGVANINEWGTVPAREEIIVALAGPFHHVMMIALGYFFYAIDWWTEEWTVYFVQGNLLLMGFNLIPVYPLDGGRVLQAILCYRFPYRAAVKLSLGISVSGALCLLIIGLWGQMHLNLIEDSFFLLYSGFLAWRQLDVLYMRFLIHRREHSVPEYAPIRQLLVHEEEPLVSVMKRLRKEAYHVLVVCDSNGNQRYIPEEAVFQSYFVHKKTAGQVKDLIA